MIEGFSLNMLASKGVFAVSMVAVSGILGVSFTILRSAGGRGGQVGFHGHFIVVTDFRREGMGDTFQDA